MKTTTRTLLALLFAFAAALALSGTAWAVETLPNSGVAGTNAGTALDKTLSFDKELLVYNPDETTVAAPQITYTYTLTAGSANKQVTDSDSVSARTKAGILPATTTATAVFNNENLTASAAGYSNKKPVSFDFSGVTFPSAGVYRYVITETVSPSNKAVAGVTEGDISNVRYLDVYVRDADASLNESDRQIYGYVMFSHDNNIDGQTGATTDTVTQAVKTSGFVSSEEPPAPGSGQQDPTPLSPDSYYTYNVEVSKTLVNDSANSSHQFPFNVSFTNATVTQNVKMLLEASSGTATAAAPAVGAISSTTSSPTIASGGSVKYIGIPAGTSVAVYERNDVTGTTYNSVYNVDGNGDTGAKKISWESGSDQSNTANIAATAVDTAQAAHTIAFTNTTELISPTGLVLRYGPFAAMLLAGIALLFVSTRKRREQR